MLKTKIGNVTPNVAGYIVPSFVGLIIIIIIIVDNFNDEIEYFKINII